MSNSYGLASILLMVLAGVVLNLAILQVGVYVMAIQ